MQMVSHEQLCSNRCFFLGTVQKSVLCAKMPALHCRRHKERLPADVANDHTTRTKMHVIQVICGLLWLVPRIGFSAVFCAWGTVCTANLSTVFCAWVTVCTADSRLTECDMQQACTLLLPFDEWKRLDLTLYKCIVAHGPSLLVQLASTTKCLYLGLPHSARSPSRPYQKSCSTFCSITAFVCSLPSLVHSIILLQRSITSLCIAQGFAHCSSVCPVVTSSFTRAVAFVLLKATAAEGMLLNW